MVKKINKRLEKKIELNLFIEGNWGKIMVDVKL